MGKSFNSSDEDSFKSTHRKRERKIKPEERLMVESGALSLEDLDQLDREIEFKYNQR